MRSFCGKFVIWTVFAISVTIMIVEGSAGDDLQAALEKMSDGEQQMIKNIGGTNGGFFDSLKEIANCIQEKANLPVDFCNFDTSYDPFYYLQECAKDTVAGQFIATIVRNAPSTEFPFGVPEVVSKDRCFNPLSPALTSIPSPIPGL